MPGIKVTLLFDPDIFSRSTDKSYVHEGNFLPIKI